MRRTLRTGMTLVELLVVITIIGVLGGIIALVAPRFQESTRVGQGTSQFKNWLESARLRAQRDKAPRGSRLSMDTLAPTLPPGSPDGQKLYYKFVYIEQPDDITGEAKEIRPAINPPPTPPPPGTIIPYRNQLNALRSQFQQAARQVLLAMNPPNTALAGLVGPTSSSFGGGPGEGWKYLLWLQGRNLIGAVQKGDVIEYGGARYTLMADPVTSAPPTNPPAAFLSSSDCFLILHRPRDEYRDFIAPGVPPQFIRNTISSPLPSYRITRSPRPIAGEPELTLPTNVAIDFVYPANANGARRSFPANAASGPIGEFDIVFSPSGELIGNVGASGRVIFWLRDVSLVDPGSADVLPPGDNRLVVLHCRTGQISTHPVDPTLGTMGTLTDPYSLSFATASRRT